ncbi:hypothetical protein BZA70DRAFT_270817 [Myxozyma melibiosi]|uniref:Chromatin modification-related protein n=1 Tax=Myxozyma melibiosi TaxID=54550 RepID=A0ABR1FBM3_9ASCO
MSTTTQVVASRQKSARIATKAIRRDGDSRRSSQHHRHQQQQQAPELYPGLNDLSDFLEAFPLEVIRHFTLLREVEAKCTSSTSLLAALIPQFLETPVTDPARDALLAEVRRVIAELLPCFEEKIHVAGSATEAVARHIERLEADYDRIAHGGEIPDAVIYGPANHPALIGDGSRDEKPQTQASSRSESRREAIAARRAAAQAADEHGAGSGVGGAGSASAVGGMASASGSIGATEAKKPARSSSSKTSQNHDNGTAESVVGAAPPAKRRKAASGAGSSEARSNNQHSGSTPVPPLPLPSPQLVAENHGRSASPARPGTPSSASQARRGGRATARNSSRRGPVNGSAAAGAVAGGGPGAVVPIKADPQSPANDPESEPVYCYCQQVSYGEMVACDGPDCKREWFHLPCVGLNAPPKGSWYCNECAVKYGKRGKNKN